jgi:hypothetical protein
MSGGRLIVAVTVELACAATLSPMSETVIPDNADYDHGGPKHRGFSLGGKMHGVWEFYRRDRSLMRSGEFDRGKQVGTWKTFDRSGALVSEKVFPPADG